MADVECSRKRTASPVEGVGPASKKSRQSPTPQDSDSGSNYSNGNSEHQSIGDNAMSVDTPLTPFSVDPNRSRVKCYHCAYPNCGKSFNRPCRLEEHIRSHTGERPFACNYPSCTKAFNRQTHLNRHIKDEHDKNRDHECTWPGCGKKFGTATRLRRHQEAHENKFHCTDYPPCNETFRKHSTLQKHILSAHLGRRPYQCMHIDEDTGKQCTQAYETASSLRAHEGRVHGGARYFCTQCTSDRMDVEKMEGQTPTTVAEPPGFPTYAALQAHIKTVHPPTCEHCGLTCSTHKQLQAHIDLAHSGVPLEARRKFICPYQECGQGFTKQGNLNVHIQSAHKGVKKFICGEFDVSTSTKDFIKAWNGLGSCGRGFATKGNLEEHIRTQHLGLEGTRKAKQKATQQGAADDDEEYTADTKKPRRRTNRAKATTLSTATRLTGAGYEEESARPIACTMPACPHRFHREYDLEFHLGAAHGLSAHDVVEAVRERAAFEDGRFWIGGVDELDAVDAVAGGWEYDGYDNEEEEDAAVQAEMDRRMGIVGAGPMVDVAELRIRDVVDPALGGVGMGNEGGEGEGEREGLGAVWEYVQGREEEV